MNLVMFDIDGTLTDTNEVDKRCYVQALSEVFHVDATDTDWTEYENVTDQGCLEEFSRRNRGRPVTQEESASTKKRYMELLVQHAETRPNLFEPIPGAIEMLEDLQRRPETTVSLATGAIMESTKIKLRVAGLACDSIPMATGSDAVSREEIMLLAERKAAEVVGINRFRTRTYVGDAPWDLQAAHNLGFSFIGIAEGAHAEALRTRGARWVLSDYREPARFLELLQSIWSA
jgi:phosphoglycolate phosphatase-like HAD superfamily hydrolase